MKEAMFYEILDDNRVKCHLCAFNCPIAEGKAGICRVKKNIGGKLYSLVYDKLSAANPDPIFRALKEFKKQGVFIEISDLLVTEMGDSLEKVEELVKWIIDNLGEEIPLHFLRFFPAYKVLDLPSTPFETLDNAYQIDENLGMKYVYLGNVRDKRNNTYCPKCGELLIERNGMSMGHNYMKNGKCPYCGAKINIGGEKWMK